MLYAYQPPLCGNSVGIVFGSFAPLHQGHLDLIMRAKKENDAGCIVFVCGFDGDKGGELMPHNMRYCYVREFFADDDLVAVYAINDTELGLSAYPNGWDGWMTEVNRIMDEVANVQASSRTWYVGDEAYYNDLTARKEAAVLLDRNSDNPICATMIRQNPIRHWDKITFPFRRVFSTNILVCGTASEGKTTLVHDIGKYFNAPYGYEWAREYMKESAVSDWELNGADYIAFLDGQYNLNKRLINSPANNGVFFADTDSMVTRMYAEYYAQDDRCALTQAEFEKVAVVADEITSRCRWDKIFMIAPHGVFVDDHTRFMAHSGMEERTALFNILRQNIERSGNLDKTTILTGGYYENFDAVRSYVRGVIEHGRQ